MEPFPIKGRKNCDICNRVDSIPVSCDSVPAYEEDACRGQLTGRIYGVCGTDSVALPRAVWGRPCVTFGSQLIVAHGAAQERVSIYDVMGSLLQSGTPASSACRYPVPAPGAW